MTYHEELCDALHCAEKRFGARFSNDAIPPIVFHDGPPQVYFPTWSRIEIRLPLRCEHDDFEARYHLRHEAVHLLSPVKRREIITLEEGLAVLFARDYLRENFDYDDEMPPPSDHRYAGALMLVERFLKPRPDAIVRLRAQEPVISRITTELIQQTYPEVPISVCLPLVTPFYALSTVA
ncbi:MAG: hypothetical protein QM796_11215 [Chthoniobacteraceae bacterium]